MRTSSARAASLLSNNILCISNRRAVFDLTRQPGLRPLHASPIFQRPRRRDFFSSNVALAGMKQDADSHSIRTYESPADALSKPQAAQQKRKTVRPAAATTSLRRVAVEAQRSKAGKSPRTDGPGEQEEGEVPTITPTTTKLVTAYAVAETFDLAKVVDILRSKGYEPDPLGTGLYPQVVHVQIPVSSIYRSTNPSARDLPPSEVGDVFIFPSGTLVTWALPEGFTSYFATRTLLPAAESPHTEPIETEDLDFIEDSDRETSAIRGETIILGTKPSPNTASPATTTTVNNQQRDVQELTPVQLTPQSYQPQTLSTVLTKIAFSSGFARSTKLAVLETSLSSYLASTASIPQLLSTGSRLPFSVSRRFILRKTGQLLLLRAQLNLYSELTDSLPDLFWDSRHELHLENYYDQVGRALDVGIRIKVLNEKMDYAAETATVLRERLSEKHGLFLEWTIIVLIAIEVMFEVLRLWHEGFWEDVWKKRGNWKERSKPRKDAGNVTAKTSPLLQDE